jgi:hypothetical protein
LSPITVHAAVGQSIDGNPNFQIVSNYQSLTLVYGAEWHIV